MKKNFVILFVGLALAGCSNGFSSGGTGSSADDSNIPGDIAGAGGSLKIMQAGAVDGVSSLSADIAFQGGWLSTCHNTVSESARIHMVVVSNIAYMAAIQYSANGCSNGTELYRTIYKYNFAAEGTKSADNGSATGLHSILEWVRLMPTAHGMSTINFDADCTGNNTWRDGISQDITGSTCFSNTQPSQNTETRSIFNVNSTILRLGIFAGDSADGSSELKRLHVLASSDGTEGELYYFTRQ